MEKGKGVVTTQHQQQQQHYPFLKEIDLAKFLSLISNYLSLGQFELARATINESASQDLRRTLKFLKQIIIEGPPNGW